MTLYIVCRLDHIYGDACKACLGDRLGPEILSMLEVKGQVCIVCVYMWKKCLKSTVGLHGRVNYMFFVT